MQLSPSILHNLHRQAIAAATQAGEYIAHHKASTVEHKTAGSSLASQVVTEVDRASQAIIVSALAESIQKYDLGLLAEESKDDGSRLSKDYFWCIDPLDGTLPFIENRPGYAVAIALIQKSGIPVIGVVYDPRAGQCYSALKGGGLFLNGKAWTLPRTKRSQLTIFHHRSLLKHPDFDHIIQEKKKELSAEQYAHCELIAHGGAIMNAIWCMTKAPAYYFALPKKEQGGGCLWDYAASVCLFNEAGLKVSDYHHQALMLNSPDSIYMNRFGVIYENLMTADSE